MERALHDLRLDEQGRERPEVVETLEYFRRAPAEEVSALDLSVLREALYPGSLEHFQECWHDAMEDPMATDGPDPTTPSAGQTPTPASAPALASVEAGDPVPMPAALGMLTAPAAGGSQMAQEQVAAQQYVTWLPIIWHYAALMLELLLRAGGGAAVSAASGWELIHGFLTSSETVRLALVGNGESAVRTHLGRVRTDPEVGFKPAPAREQQPPAQPAAVARGSGHFKAPLKPPQPFAGEGAGRVQLLHSLSEWMARVRTGAALAGMSAAEATKWATAHLAGAAQRWWTGLSEPEQDTVSDLGKLQRWLALQITKEPFEALEEDLTNGSLRKHKSYEEYRAWLTRTHSSLSVYGDTDKQEVMTDRELISCVLRHVKGTRYAEDVAQDPSTKLRPTSWVQVLQLLDNRHAALRALDQEWSSRSVPVSGSEPEKRRKTGAQQSPGQAKRPQQQSGKQPPAKPAKGRHPGLRELRDDEYTPLVGRFSDLRTSGGKPLPEGMRVFLAKSVAWTGRSVADIRHRYTEKLCVLCGGARHPEGTHCPRPDGQGHRQGG